MIEATLTAILDEVRASRAEVRELRKAIEQREDETPWQTRAELAKRLEVHPDTVDRRSGPGGDIERRTIGRAVRVRLRPRVTEAEVSAAAARALA